jgi:ATP-dependent helicase/nuclease subunit B
MSQLSYDDVLQFLTAGKQLITVNSRLRDRLAWHYAEGIQLGQNKKTWIKPPIYTLEEKLNEIWRGYELAGIGVPVLLTKEQERALWTKIIQAQYPEGFIQLSKIVGLAMQAWRNVHLWAMTEYLEGDQVGVQGSEDAKKFIAWANKFKTELKQNQWITGAQRIGYFLSYPEILSSIWANQSWLLIGFDDLPPIYEQFMAQKERVDLALSDARASQISFRSVAEEFQVAARWAKALVQKGEKNIGIVHPELAMHRHKIEEIFIEVFHPEHIYCAQKIVSPEFTLSAGTPLGSQILVKAALKLLALVQTKFSISEIEFILRHGYIGKNISQLSENLRVIRLLKTTECSMWPVEKLLVWLKANTESEYILDLFLVLNNTASQTKNLSSPISVLYFIESIRKILSLFDFPGERLLSSLEYQTTQRLYQAIENYSDLAMIIPEKKYLDHLIDFETYLNFIPFQAESGEVPVNIMGVLEASGQLFSHLWVMGMNNHNWPASPEPNPFLPYDLQREKNMPHASAEREYEISNKISDRLKISASLVYFSYSQYEEDKPRLPSECIQSLEVIDLGMIEQSGFTQDNQALTIEQIEDNQAPKVDPNEKISGGTSILKAQAACPFKGFSEVRLKLKAENSLEAVLGISAMERGILIHDILDKLWAELKSHQNLLTFTQDELQRLIQEKMKQGIEKFREKDQSRLGDKFWLNEAINLKKVLVNWLNLEKEREPFEVLLRESWQKIHLEGLTLNLRIDRLDLTASQEAILIDYKTGEMSLASCFGDRLNEPQLPIYCLLGGDHAALGVAFGMVKPTGECSFVGITYSEGALPGVKSASYQQNYLAKLGVDCKNKLENSEVWTALCTYWQKKIGQLAREFIQGAADVSPKNQSQTCRYCHLMGLCRINEKIMT